MYPYNNMPEAFHPSAQMDASTVPNVMMDMPDVSNQAELPMQMQQQNVGGVTFEPQIDYGVGPQNFDGVNMGDGLNPSTQQPTIYDINIPPFDIEDAVIRREFFRKVFTILLLQNIIVLPAIEIFILCFDQPVSFVSYSFFSLLAILLFIPMYMLSDYRRFMPMNVLSLLLTTVFLCVEEGMHATYVETHVAFGAQLLIIVQILVMIVYSKQTRFKFSNVNAFLILIFMFVVVIVAIGVIVPSFITGIHINIFYVMYCVYDMHLQLTGHHAYNLKPEEAIFSAANIYADLVNLLWRFFRYIFLDHFVRMFNFFRNCCFAEVC